MGNTLGQMFSKTTLVVCSWYALASTYQNWLNISTDELVIRPTRLTDAELPSKLMLAMIKRYQNTHCFTVCSV